METDKQKLKAIPHPNSSWDKISNYALTHNGYEHNPNVAGFANTLSVYFYEKKEIPFSYTIDDLKDCLFYEQRRFRHYGWAPEGEDLKYIQALLSEIRDKTIELIMGARNIKQPMIELFIGGYGGINHRIVSDGRIVFFYKEEFLVWNEVNKKVFLPSENKWKTFWQFIESIVLQWSLEYMNSDVCDGTQWELSINRDKIQMTYSGSNAFPENFDAFLKTVSKNLIGGLKIY